MAVKLISDYISSGVTSDSTNTLNLTARGVLRQRGVRNQIVHLADDGASEEVISLASAPTFYIDTPWRAMTSADSGTVMHAWASTAWGDGIGKRFRYVNAYGTETETLTVRFDSDLTRDIREGNIHGASMTLKVIGKVT